MTTPIACGQMACIPFDLRSNLDKADEVVREATRLGGRLVLLPELFATGYTYDRRLHDFGESSAGSTAQWMQRRSRQTGAWIGAGIVEQAEGRYFDSFLLTGPAGELHVYRKQYPAFFEQLYFHRGQKMGIFDTAIGRIGVMICWDMVQARLSRKMAGRIDLLVISSAWPDLRRGNIPLYGVRQWLSQQPAVRPRQLAEHLDVPVAYCNMTGEFVTRVPGLGLTYRSQFAGNSSIIDQGGRVMTALRGEEKVLIADVRIKHDRMTLVA